MKNLQILGTRGIPAKHGGFETFTEHFSLYLKNKGWNVIVYCQENGVGKVYEDDWNGIHRIHIPVTQKGAKGTIVFDWLSTVRASKIGIPVLTLGYNTAIFCFLYRLKGIKNIINMDGIEWHRGKWTALERAWLYLNEKLGSWIGNHLVADHPEIKNHLAQFVSADKIKIIPYSANFLKSADITGLEKYELQPEKYAILIARPEPENSIIEIVRAFSKKKRGMPLVILGNYNPDLNEYQKKVLDAGSNEIMFLGAIYDQAVVHTLRFYARFHIHGHTVGGTNPSLVEALGAGSPILAHNNKFNRWVAGERSLYFDTETACAEKIDEMIGNDTMIKIMKEASRRQYKQNFTTDKVHGAYENLFKELGF